MNILAQIITWINVPTNALGKFFLAPAGMLPGWLSNMIISALAGVFFLIIFKYTSNQAAIGRVRNNMKANMLALKLFKDSMAVTLQALGRIFKGASLLLFHAIRPILVMIVPVCLLLGQMGPWYQFRPLHLGEETIVTLKLNNEIALSLQDLSIETTPAAEITMGPIRALSKGEVYWKIIARKNGYHRIVFQVGNQRTEKEVAIGTSFMRISAKRPAWCWTDIMLYPGERPFVRDSIIQSISIDYPKRMSHICGIDWWIVYFFVFSLISAFIFKPFLKVKI